MFKREYVCVILVLLTALSTVTFAADAPSKAPPSNDAVTRVYDIADLLVHKSNYPVGGQNGGQDVQETSQALFNPPANASGKAPNSLDPMGEFVKLIEDTVAPTSWSDNGGSDGRIRGMDSRLIILQTPDNHQHIADLLAELRKDQGRMVVVRAYWLLLEPANVPAVPFADHSLPIVDEKLMDAKHLYCAAQTTCFSGQTVHINSGRKRTVVTNMTPVVGANAVGFNPTVEMANDGIQLQITPQLEPDGPDARIVLDLQSNVTELGGPEAKLQFPGSTINAPTTQFVEATPSIDRLNELNQEMRTTVRIPLAKKVLVGGMTFEPAAKEEAGQQLYLVVEASTAK